MKIPIIGGIAVLVLTAIIGGGLVKDIFESAVNGISVEFESVGYAFSAIGVCVFAGLLLIWVGRKACKT